MADKKKMDAVRKRMLAKVEGDIKSRDKADIQAAEEKVGTWKMGGRTVAPMYPDKYTGKLSETEKMAAKDAFERENRRGVTYGSSDSKTGKPLTEEEGNATRKRLKRLYGAK